MLLMPNNSSSTITLIGIDPGSTHLGVGLIYVDLNEFNIINSTAFTINAAKSVKKDSWVEYIHGNRFNRILELENQLLNIFQYYRPFSITSESPFFNSKFPLAGSALVEVLSAIRKTVFQYDAWLSLNLVSPSEVKQALGAKGNCTKNVMIEKLIESNNDIKYNGQIPIHLLDEHSVDALAVCYYSYNKLKSNYLI